MIPVVTTNTKKLTLIAAIVAAFVLPAAAQAATTTLTIPYQANVLACNGDTIQLSGQLMGVFSATFDAAGGVTLATHTRLHRPSTRHWHMGRGTRAYPRRRRAMRSSI